MRTGELAELTGVAVETVRYYEKSGLLSPPARAANGYRLFEAAHLERLAFIRHCRALTEVSKLLNFVDHPASDCGDVNLLVDNQLARVRARITSMRALETQLVALRKQCAATHATNDCGMLRELVLAAHGEARACHSAHWHAASTRINQLVLTVNLLSTLNTPLTALAMSVARMRAASDGAGPYRLTTPFFVSTSILSALKSGSLIRPAATNAVMTASSLVKVTLSEALAAAVFAWSAL